MAFEIPLSPQPQNFNVTINGVVYGFNLYWNTFVQAWFLDISDQNGNPLVQGVTLTTGLDLLGAYGYLNFGFKLLVQTDNNTFAQPTFTNLGITSHLYVA